MIIVPSNDTTIGVYSLEHNERYDVITSKECTLSFYNKSSPYGLFTVPSIRCMIAFHTTCYFCDSRMSKI